RKGRKRLFWLSALTLGITAASKYTYLIVLVPLAVILYQQRKTGWKSMFAYGLVALATFVLFDPTLWADPINRLAQSLTFHAGYTQSQDVLRAAYPWYQPVLWILQTVPWHPKVFFFFTTDEIVFFFGLAGMYWEFKRRPWAPIWFAAGLLILLAWETKWPQYTLILMVPLALAAATFMRRAWAWLVDRYNYWGVFEDLKPEVSRWVWILVIVLASGLTIANVAYEIHMAIARHGWMQLSTSNAPLVSDLVNDVFAGEDGRMAIATNAGVSFWTPEAKVPWGEESAVTTYTTGNSDLSDARVLSIVQDHQGSWWFGTENGIERLQGATWQAFSPADLGLPQGSVQEMKLDGQNRLWAATL
ncbi:hypothetical protein FDZ74_15705, partial [bacterium]